MRGSLVLVPTIITSLFPPNILSFNHYILSLNIDDFIAHHTLKHK